MLNKLTGVFYESHPNDRFITVISGTWWVGTGENYDGAKDGGTILQIVGIGLAH